MKSKLFFISGFLFFLSFTNSCAGGSGEVKTFYYNENGIGKTVTAEYVGLQIKRTYIAGTEETARTVVEANYKPWNGNWEASWGTMLDQSTPYATKNALLITASMLQKISVSEYNGKRLILELVIAEGEKDYYWFEEDKLYYMQKQYEVK